MTRLSFSFLFISLPYFLRAVLPELSGNVVCLTNQNLEQGLNEIKVNVDAVPAESAFTTLDKVVKFHPADGVLGDELVFDLDGFRQQYRFDGYCRTGEVYRLVRTHEVTLFPEMISLNAIPLPDMFWINHVSSNKVLISTFGIVAGKYKRIVESMDSPKTNANVFTLRIVPPDERTAIFKEISFGNGRVECNNK